ncbi:sigma-70 family RNA polymerase sigma factor (plasmid) [Streptomyces erythrochromogenes]|uniref:Sigma-70 family RNA polymerase sigma factor n=1 Tax=Streptomyces erythrochromogenes TaxID=285574 RepID=A0ABZ1QQA8_9ACTN|nr:sigma-70 family RNA polymerase sigma factor [Streptomyces erythrochromogenes]
MVGEQASEEVVVLAVDVAQRLYEAYASFMETEPYELRREFRTLPLATCQDVAQEAYLKVGRAAAEGKLDADTDVMAYLHKAARNLAVDKYRRQKRLRRHSVLMGGDALDVLPARRTLAQEDREVLQEVVIPQIRSMRDSQRRRVVELQSRGLSDREIALLMEISVERLHNLRNKAVTHLRGKLAGHIRDEYRKTKKSSGEKDR